MTPIYHITHVGNLPSIVTHDCLWSDAQRIAQQIGNVNIGHVHIKQRRLQRPVPVAAGGVLGEYVPFNFCNRSVMLFPIHRNCKCDSPTAYCRRIRLVLLDLQ